MAYSSKRITKGKVRALADLLRYEAIEDCQKAHEIDANSWPKKNAAMKERAIAKLDIAIRLEQLL